MKLVNYNRPFPTDVFRFFDDHRTQARQAQRPAVNITEMDDAFALELLAPGRKRDLFNIAFNEGTLEISYTSEAAGETTDAGTVRRREFELKDFTRSFKLDDTVIDDEAINATYEDGVLRLTLPKREQALPKAPRQIEVA
ncbi:Hsp20/alpha crystallin family protein [Lewinella sp. 4G2]|uniref:Hsp20/alpha crystallin family protein n=1 Tax=Lewinella sp. 4G2 TaxID=1803372 RepID=UPI0007B4D9DB|nr:Hsp20/alpha crystallin family protein [Lewinella sp. 4G2]OAV44467.1 hypothetical protein A3850_008175 [Lewinella sp. 4G2]